MKRAVVTGAIVLILAILALVLLRGDSLDTAQEKIKPVKVMELSKEITPVILDYTGIVSPEEIRKMGFKSSGRITGVYVEEGQLVKKGDMLAALDTKELQHAKKAAEQELSSARDALEFSRSVCQRMESLYQEGAVSLQELEKARLDRDLQQSALNRSMVNMDNIQDSIDDAVLMAGMDAYVVDILYEEGEMAAAGYPVVIIRSGDQVANAGLSDGDAAKVPVGTPVKVKADDREVLGEVTYINLVPDDDTRTYNAKIALEGSPFNIGAIVRLEIILGQEEGIWIPVTSVMVDGKDYVYIIEDDRAVKREVTMDGVRSSSVRVKGLNSGESLVTEGYRNLKNGDKVLIHR